MPIYAPARRINPTIRRTATGRKDVHASLFLTSLVDMFAILVIFLLMNFSAEGELIILPHGVELPKAQNTGQLKRAPSLVISKEFLMFEGEEIAFTADVARQDVWVIPPLQEKLAEFKKKLEDEKKVRELSGAEPEDLQNSENNTQKINISADRRLEFGIVKKVIYNAGFAGFPDFRFAVYGSSDAQTQ